MRCLSVSIITPSYNQAEFLEEAICSVQFQTYPRVEHVIVDGASTDGTVQLLERHSETVRWLSEPDNGEVEAINKGLQLAMGDIVGILSADNTYLPQAVATVISAFDHNPDVGLIYGDYNAVDAAGTLLNSHRSPDFDFVRFIRRGSSYICQATAFFRRSVIHEIGLCDTSIRFAHDYDFWLRIASRYPVLHIPVVLANFRVHTASQTARNRRALNRESRAVTLKYYRPSMIDWFWFKWHDARLLLYHWYDLIRITLRTASRRP